MLSISISRTRPTLLAAIRCRRTLATAAQEHRSAKAEGDISSVFRSLSGSDVDEKLPQRFADVKSAIRTDRATLQESWNRLLNRLKDETRAIKDEGSSCIPQIDFADIDNAPAEFDETFRKRGVAVVRQVVPEKEARGFKEEVERYVAANPSTRAFPPDKPVVFELYWSRPQLAARLNGNMSRVQTWLMSYYNAADPQSECSTQQPLMYADRLRIRQPGDAGFALGPHVDGGSCERWEEEGYGKAHVYDKILEGRWEDFDAWELSTRIEATQDLYDGAGACSMLRTFQGWLGMSNTGPREGTLLVNPLLSLSTAYLLLRPFFAPKSTSFPPPARDGEHSAEYLDPDSWVLADPDSPDLQGAWPGSCQELSHRWHPHLDLPHTMVPIPRIRPGDYVAWHCDTIHAVDGVHAGDADSSVMYIPACPMTRQNVDYARQQREHFLHGIPPSDFPGGVGESRHVGRPGADVLKELAGTVAQRAAGFAPFDVSIAKTEGEAEILRYGNQVMGF
ncbi:DUF1479 domain protein [Geosmithia morbida]|uniref:DUF1479 domain protein n=1 Tax=Geosmithia morbida TaxID=1094350 RepID=A0A9P4YXR9_9HYPO|nr:DUF1479 domain protein [Geosmithia morbida]KAF4125033.1 DUF1479 domain protein [Geosmithia morbida]